MSASRLPRLAILPILAALSSLVFASSVAAAEVSIISTGPLTRITITDQLNCQVQHSADTDPEFFGGDPGACGTFVVIAGVLYNPASVPAGGGATIGTDFTPVSQTPVTGAGTAADPYRIVTVVALGTSGVTLTQTDSYVIGNEYYQTDVTLASAAGVSGTVYRAGDCYLQNSDDGFGSVNAAAGAIRCVAAADPLAVTPVPGTRIEEWVPLTAGSAYFQSFYATVWSRIGAMTPFDNTCQCDVFQDNGAGLSWGVTVAAGGTTTVSHLTNFSPQGFSAVATPTPAPTPAPVIAPTAAPTAAPVAAALPNTAAMPLVSMTMILVVLFLLAGLALVVGRTRLITRR